MNFFDQALQRSKRLYAQRGALVFIAVFTAASLLGSLLMGLVCLLLSLPWRSDMDRWGTGELLFIVAIFAPLTETLLTQMLPVSLARRFFRANDFQCFLAASVPFALLHAQSAISTVLAAGIPCGIFLGLAYVSLLDQGKGRAFVVVTAIHALHNLAPVVLALA